MHGLAASSMVMIGIMQIMSDQMLDGQAPLMPLPCFRFHAKSRHVTSSFLCTGTWPAGDESVPFGYDFWYQPYYNVMISTEWGAPNAFKVGFDPAHVAAGRYGTHLNVWDWTSRRLMQVRHPPNTGTAPTEYRYGTH